MARRGITMVRLPKKEEMLGNLQTSRGLHHRSDQALWQLFVWKVVRNAGHLKSAEGVVWALIAAIDEAVDEWCAMPGHGQSPYIRDMLHREADWIIRTIVTNERMVAKALAVHRQQLDTLKLRGEVAFWTHPAVA